MKVLCTAMRRMDEIQQYMIAHARLFGGGTEVVARLYDDPSYEPLTSYFAKVEKEGPEDTLLPDYLGECSDCEIAISFYEPYGSEVFDGLPSLRVAGSIRGGSQHINAEEATRRGVAVFGTPGRNAHSVSDYTIAMMLAEARELARNAHSLWNGQWVEISERNHYQPELYRKTVGIVGLGAIGRLVASKLKGGWDARIVAYDPFVSEKDAAAMGVELVTLEELFRASDFVTLHAKVTEENERMIGADLIGLMKPTAFFINTARAALVDTNALYDALKEKRIAGAALDVLDTEPVEPDEPMLKLSNVTVTGHLAGNSSDTTFNSPRLLVEEIVAFIKGESTRGLVNPEVLDDPGLKAWREAAARQLG